MHRSENLSAAITAAGQEPFGAIDQSSAGESERVIAFLREAATLFQKTPMPLEICLSLRRWLAQRSPHPDQLATGFQIIQDRPKRLRTLELQHLPIPSIF
jgi:hypothetical protein